MKKMPPIEKVYEAWTAIADDRVEMKEGEAVVKSSDGAKSYTVRFHGDQYSSDDNATFWQGYPGYPVIAVLMLQERLPLDRDEIKQWSDINWTELNKKHRNKYASAVEEIENERHIDPLSASSAAEDVMARLASLPLEIKRKIKL